jgi:vesicle-associated membrane protein 7
MQLNVVDIFRSRAVIVSPHLDHDAIRKHHYRKKEAQHSTHTISRQNGILISTNDSPPLASLHPTHSPPLSPVLTIHSSSCIAHNTTILSECTTSASSQTSSLASLILPKIDHSTPQKLTYTHGDYHIHYIAESPRDHASNPSAGGLVFLAIASSSLGRRITFSYLLDIQRLFFAKFNESTTDFAELPNYGAASFNGDLRAQMVEYGTGQKSDDAIGNAKKEIDDVRGIMTRNIEGLLERGERIDLLVDKTDRLGGSAREFRVRSRGLKRKMWWKNVKLMGLLGTVLVLIILAIVLAVKNAVH